MMQQFIKAELCPNGYQFMDQCRNGHHEGRTGLMFRDSFRVKKAGGGKHKSLKFSELIAVIIYRTPYSEVHPVTSDTFCTEIARYMESILLTKENLTITRDMIRYNIHHCCQMNPLHLLGTTSIIGIKALLVLSEWNWIPEYVHVRTNNA